MRLQQPAVQWAQWRYCDLSLARGRQVNGSGFFLCFLQRGYYVLGRAKMDQKPDQQKYHPHNTHFIHIDPNFQASKAAWFPSDWKVTGAQSAVNITVF